MAVRVLKEPSSRRRWGGREDGFVDQWDLVEALTEAEMFRRCHARAAAGPHRYLLLPMISSWALFLFPEMQQGAATGEGTARFK